MQYVALLRGINVGRPTKMEDLREVFESLGYDGVRTVLASGNVVFETRKTAVGTLTRRIEDTLEQAFGYRITVVVRPHASRRRASSGFSSMKPKTRTAAALRRPGPAATSRVASAS